MIFFTKTVAVLISAYLLGSIPTAFIISKRIKRMDIRSVGDGNMGAVNIFHEIGHKFGVMVGIIDIAKGALSVFLAYILGLHLGWQMMAGILVILGHDFPVFANCKGGQGAATSFGTMLILFPVPILIALIPCCIVFLIKRNWIMVAIIGGITIVSALGIFHQWSLLGYAIIAFILIPIKLLIDSPRRRIIKLAKNRSDFT